MSMLIFFIGMAEMVFSTLWAKYVQETRVYASTLITVAHVFVWYYVLRTVIEQVNNISVVIMYAAGCGIGNFLVIMMGEMAKKRSTRKTHAKAKALGTTVPAMPALVTFDNV